jgi:hypothetical protein
MTAVRRVPLVFKDGFTLNGEIPIIDYYFDDIIGYDYSENYTKENIEKLISMAKEKKTINYLYTEEWLYKALEKYSIEGKTVAIMGSEKPTFESICLAYGGIPYVIEYKKLSSSHPGISYITVAEYDSLENPVKCEAAFSISSFEHDGLGRYGDPIDPDGDLKAMKKMKFWYKGTGPDGSGDPREMKKRLKDNPELAKKVASKTFTKIAFTNLFKK